jgi:hypothetical protein
VQASIVQGGAVTVRLAMVQAQVGSPAQRHTHWRIRAGAGQTLDDLTAGRFGSDVVLVASGGQHPLNIDHRQSNECQFSNAEFLRLF